MNAANLKPEDIAARIGKTRPWVIEHCRRGELPHSKFGQSIRFSEDDYQAIVARFHVNPKAVDPSGLTNRSRKSA